MLIAGGIDVGGTKIASGLVNLKTGEVLAQNVVETGVQEGDKEVLSRIIVTAEMLSARAKELGIGSIPVGIGLPELVDREGEIVSDWNFSLKARDIHQSLKHLGSVSIDSDVRCGARAEKNYGAGRRYANFSYISIGTGISSTQIIDGKIIFGSRGFAIHFGSSSLVSLDNNTNAHEFCLEEYASGLGIAKSWKRKTGQTSSARRLLAGESGIEGEKFVESTIEAMASYLGQMVNLLDPEALVVGGGLGRAQAYFEKLQALVPKYIWAYHAKTIPIIRESINGNAGLIGAAIYGAEMLHRDSV